MASFSTYITKLLKAEGGYVNDPVDKGGETYAGISRKNWPNWSGWAIIDKKKLLFKNNTITKGTLFPELQNALLQFYQSNYWNKIQASKFQTQVVAEICVDWLINGGFTVSKLQTIIKDLGLNIAVDNIIGDITINALNHVNQKDLYTALIQARKDYYNAIVSKDSSQMKYLQGWLNRLNEFKAPILAVSGGLLTAGIVAFFFFDPFNLFKSKR